MSKVKDLLDSFDRFENLRQSGIVNMNDKNRVCALCDISSDEYDYIISHYSDYSEVVNEYERNLC